MGAAREAGDERLLGVDARLTLSPNGSQTATPVFTARTALRHSPPPTPPLMSFLAEVHDGQRQAVSVEVSLASRSA